MLRAHLTLVRLQVPRDLAGIPQSRLVQDSFIATPSVRSFVRRHFNCPTLQGDCDETWMLVENNERLTLLQVLSWMGHTGTRHLS